MSVRIREFLAGDAVQLVLQPSQHRHLGLTRPFHSIEDGRELEAGGPAWTAIGDDGHRSRILACYGFTYLWPPSEISGGHAVAWALLAEDLGRAHVAITRFARDTIAASPIDRIEAIVRADVAADCRWAEMVGFVHAATLRAWGPERKTHLLFERIRGDRPPPPIVDLHSRAPRLEAVGAV
jgi:hypothetical protein